MNTQMFIVENQVAQGDCYIKRVAALPEGLKPMKKENGVYIVAHSETGHHHVVEGNCNVYEVENDPMTLYMEVIDASEVVLKHLRSWDTHNPFGFLKGFYRIRRQREYTPLGWRAVAD